MCEAKGEQAAQRLQGLKKGDMTEVAAQLLAGTGWLPEVLRTVRVTTFVTQDDEGEEKARQGATAEQAAQEVEAEKPPVPVVEDVRGDEPRVDPQQPVGNAQLADSAFLAAE